MQVETLRFGLSTATLDESVDPVSHRPLRMRLQHNIPPATAPSVETGTYPDCDHYGQQWVAIYLLVCDLRARTRRRLRSSRSIVERNSVHHPTWVDHTTGHVPIRAAHLPTYETEPTTRGMYLIIFSSDQ